MVDNEMSNLVVCSLIHYVEFAAQAERDSSGGGGMPSPDDSIGGVACLDGAGASASIASASGEGIAALPGFMLKLLSSGPEAEAMSAADVAQVARHVQVALAELRVGGTAAFITIGGAVDAVILTLSVLGERDATIAHACCTVLRIVCDSAEGREVTSNDVTAVVPSEGSSHRRARHGDDVGLLEGCLAALAGLMQHSASPAAERAEALLHASVDDVYTVAADQLHRHSDRAAVVRQALRVVVATSPSRGMRMRIAERGGGDVLAMVLAKHFADPFIARDAAFELQQLLYSLSMARRLDPDFARHLGVALRRYIDDEQAGTTAEAPRVASALMGTLAQVLDVIDGPEVWAKLAAVIDDFHLVDAMRKHMAHPAAATAACELLGVAAYTKAEGAAVRVPHLALAGAAALVVDILEAHEADAVVVAAASKAFYSMCCDEASKVQLAEPQPVLLLLKLLRCHLHDAEAAMCLLGQALPSVAASESARSALMDDGAAGETLRLAMDAARIHKAESMVVCGALHAIKSLCRSYSDYTAAHAVGAFALALDLARERGEDAEIAGQCLAVLFVAVQHGPALQRLVSEGGPATIIGLLKRHSGEALIVMLGCQALVRVFKLPALLPEPSVFAAAVPVLLAASSDFISIVQIVGFAALSLAAAADVVPDVILKAGGVPVLVHALQQHLSSGNVVCGAVTSLASIAGRCPVAGAAAAANAKALPLLISAMDAHGKHTFVALPCYRIVHAMHEHRNASGVCRAELDCNAAALLPAIARSMRHHTSNEATIDMACTTLYALSREASYRPHFARGGVIPLLLGVLRRYADSGSVEEHAVFAAASTLHDVAASPECASLIRSLKGWDDTMASAVLFRLGAADTEAKKDIELAVLHLRLALAKAK